MPTDFDPRWDFQDPAGTERVFRALLPEVASDPPRHAELLSQIARAEGLQHRFDDAHRTLDQAEALMRDTPRAAAGTAAWARADLRCILERGRVFNSSGDPVAASERFVAALERARAAGEENLAVDAAHMLGISEPPEHRLAWNLEALAMAERATEARARAWRGSLYNNIGWTLHDAGEYERALDMFERALAFRIEQAKPRETRIARWCVARTLRSLGRIPEALEQQRELLAEAERLNEPDGFVYEELGECLLALDRGAEAAPHFARAHELLAADPWLAGNEPARIERLARIGGATGA